MTITYVVINIVIMLIMLLVLNKMARIHVKFSRRVFTALGVGILFGALLQIIFKADSTVVKQTADWIGIVGNGYVSFLKMIVMPLVMVSIIQAITNLESSKGLGKMAGMVIGILIFTTLIAATVGSVTADVFGLNASDIQSGQVEKARSKELQTKLGDVQEQTVPEKIVSFIPENPFMDMTGSRPTSTLAVVIFSAFLGVAALQLRRKKPEQAEMFNKIVNALYAVIMRMVTLILRMTPYGVLALMTTTVAQTNVKGILSLGEFVIASYVALIIMFLIHFLLITFTGLNPINYIKKVIPTLIFAFTSRTSAGSIPMNIETQTKRLGVEDGIANLSASFGASIGQNGCAGVYPAMLAVMIAPTVGINPWSIGFLVKLILIVAISSFGVAGVGGGATFAALIVLSSMNLPVGLAGLLISVEPLIDMGRTALNVDGSMTAGVLTAHLLGKLDKNKFNDMSLTEDSDEMA
ncbi:L-cystine transporter [Latilactobacillus curvatus]|nr:L-cystine transporter [Latilactobacillus curvatus]ANJ70029.1 sodium:dicarboxylate symporter [Latilactobacillus curvatus]MCS8581971.1 L-cystine transporter [Latilactobacillus curvatus]MCS8606169.1 L-cystine transporter [Latilactobacillus curvatus]QEA48772.1 L-cystine transporter [Latilactobacillus curvatus]UTC13222.1 sodium:dicarboxylate symporter [Latilactobacillus curvatus]